MQITVNGQVMDFDGMLRGADLLSKLRIAPSTVVAEHNGEIVRREEFLELALADGDILELVTVVGGG